MREVTVTDLRAGLAHHLDAASRGEPVTILRDGQPVAVLLRPEDAAWALGLARLFKDRLPPFTQHRLNEWAARIVAPEALAAVLAAC